MAQFWYLRTACSSKSAKDLAWTTFRFERVLISPLQQLLQQFDRQVPLRHATHLGQEVVGKNRDVRLLEASGGENVKHLARNDGPRDDLPDGQMPKTFDQRLAARLTMDVLLPVDGVRGYLLSPP